MGAWNGLDFFFFLIFVVNLVIGMARGATREIIALMCLCFAVIVTIKFTIPLTGFLNASPLLKDVVTSDNVQNFFGAAIDQSLTEEMLKQTAYCIALLLCFTAAYAVTVAGLSVTGFVEIFSFPFATLNRKVGAVLGCTRGYVIILLILVCAIHFYHNNNLPGKDWFNQSFFANLFSDQAKKFDQLIIAQNPDRYREIFEGQGKFGAKEIMKQLDGGKNKNVKEFESLLEQSPATGTPPDGDTAAKPDTSQSVSGDLRDYNGPPPSGS